ncbi:MAG: outer membrane protein assembly factor BamD [Buchnera aphidicola (Brevicoryne brassicae)]|uniref:Outer membrane protein assembly factor BamD n=1 Tax=Buchnera aphidicola (Brevicoryne brassicae) TaxID=911343 RepID=A0AAJ5TX70_9GAMM|nr:outer membrane protein assembly factor BamD [Buchnera aphidicola]QCI19960.1 outer membrane protein assembly factor BamD [Buchnera aphidicola (Brevicoryne brassicae)]WAI18784.1 MAG: outer membrane protein assembly factor BamD [Buchnera aphidicola (Brevicoryne brassicae)]
MKKNYKMIFIFIIICVNLTVHCKSSNDYLFITTDILYKYSKKKLKEKKFDEAINILEKIKNDSIVNFNNDKIQINLIYAYYKNFNFNMAQKTVQEFIYFHPNHPNIDYVLYMQSLISLAMDKNTFFKILPIEYYKSDPIHAINAFFQLQNLIYHYPKSLYIINAKKNIISIKKRLSEHDFKILKFYFSHKKYISVINRGTEIIQKYPETQAARKTLIYMEKSFFALNILDTAKKISKIISLNSL